MHIDMYSILVQIRISTLMILPDKVKVSSHKHVSSLKRFPAVTGIGRSQLVAKYVAAILY